MRLLFLFLCISTAFADGWSLRESKELSAAGAAVQCVYKQLQNGTVLYLAKADMRRCALKVSPDAKPNVASALERVGCVAGVNGGFFHPNGEPLGLVISNGRTVHALEGGKLLSGLVVFSKGRALLLRTGELRRTDKIAEAIQAGPFLIDKGRSVPGLNSTKRAARTVALSDGKNNFAFLVCYSVTLERMASILCDSSVISEMQVLRGLNLDGGSSTAFWVQNPPIVQREFKAVANAIGFAP